MNDWKTDYSFVQQPCKNFNILASTDIIDPIDGKQKWVLSNFAAGGVGNLIFIDTATEEAEAVPLPGDSGAWGLVNWNNEKLIVGTCPEHAYLHCFDLATRTWAEPLQPIGEKYFWELVVGSDGMIYGGTWPGCALIRYDPVRHKLEHLGRVSEQEKNQYSRYLSGDLPGYIFIAYGFEQSGMKVFDIASGTLQEFGLPGFRVKEINDQAIVLASEDQLAFYHKDTFDRIIDDSALRDQLVVQEILLPNGKLNRVIPLGGGKLAGIRGQDYFILDHPDQVPMLKRIPTTAPPTAIHSLIKDENGLLWGCSAFGQTIFTYNPSTKASWNSSSVCDAGGEVYGMQMINGRLFMSSYIGGDHIVYDPRETWDQLNNRNPMSLLPVRPAYIRPEGGSVIGPDGGFWTGWSAKYGTYGGALTKVDPVSLEVEQWAEPVPGQQIAGLAADGHYLYFTTNGGASGLPTKMESCCFGVWSPKEHLVYLHRFEEEGQTGSAILAAGEYVFVGVGSKICVFHPVLMKFVNELQIREASSCMVKLNDRAIAVFSGNLLLIVNTSDFFIEKSILLPGKVRTAAVIEKRELYFAVGASLYCLIIAC
ncbi:hypothetical protein PAT3040_06272 [Paenibacillus agaridevorans]|uniref:Uncharacterized protein n=1 Tax=Paenibacillus agaridevorans TaxID=171404 RepID=A0A2R5F4C2_9BACL|nr:hypothetical protein [Paenibacillus agaridevorans]GBG11453.1 hypothetical protein PAT3040_06272 [Paenibacillus agaridevorans]